MKTIEVSDEMYDFLMETSKELNSQDHRGTRMPYFFQVQTEETICVPEGCGTIAWHMDGGLIETDEEIKDSIFEYKEWDIDSDIHEEMYQDMDEWERNEIMEEMGYDKIYQDKEKVYRNAFLTERACREHIRLNDYHYNNPKDYLSYAFRNPELEMVFKFLCELTGGEIHK
jgi:hypothetical protein